MAMNKSAKKRSVPRTEPAERKASTSAKTGGHPKKESAAEWRIRDDARREAAAKKSAEARKNATRLREGAKKTALASIPKRTTFFERVFRGTPNPLMICPHCGSKGTVRTQLAAIKSGVSGSKIALALVTGGLSLIPLGLSGSQWMTAARCDACRSNWKF